MSRFYDLVSKPARDLGNNKTMRTVPAQERPSPVVKLDSNENPFGPSPRAVEAMAAAVQSTNLYPDDDCARLRSELAAHHALPSEQVLVTAGSTALLSLLCQTLLAPGLNAVTSRCSFIVYSMAAQAAGAHLIEVPTQSDGFDLQGILAAIDAQTRIVFLPNPNNPTGTMLEASEVDAFLARVPAHVVVILDEAYYEFAQHFAALRQLNYSNSLEYVRQGASVVVLRTFSKAHGLAGLRIGYGLGPAELLAYCARMRNTFSVSSLAQAAALAAIDDSPHIRRVVENNAMQARVLYEGLSALGFRVVPTSANFIFCDLGNNAAAVAHRLRTEGVSVRPLGHWGAPNCIRVSIGTPEQNAIFLYAVRNLRSSAATDSAPRTLRR